MTNYKDFISNILTEMADFRAYHGTPKVFGDFEYHAAGKGNDALGAGFYFTDSTDVANAYTEETEGSNIRVATLTMDKPIVIEDHGEGEVIKSKPLTRLQIQKLVTSSPYFSQEIGNWDDVEFKGLGVVTRNVVNTYFEERDPMSQLIGIMREFYLKDLEAFSVNAKKYTGYDGIEKIFYNVGRNRDETWRHYVVWNKNQIKPMRPVNESSHQYPTIRDITKLLRNNLWSSVSYKILDAYVVGSEAKGEARDDSDLDIAVIIPPKNSVSDLKLTERYHQNFRNNNQMPKWNGRIVDFQFFYPESEELKKYSKIKLSDGRINESSEHSMDSELAKFFPNQNSKSSIW